MHDISSDEEPLIPSGRNVVSRLGAEFVGGRFPFTERPAHSPSNSRDSRRGGQGVSRRADVGRSAGFVCSG